MSFEVLKAVTRVTAVFRNVTPCGLTEASVHCYETKTRYIQYYSNLHILRQLCNSVNALCCCNVSAFTSSLCYQMSLLS